jgi:hypothetical protein
MKKPNTFFYLVTSIIGAYLLAACSSLIPPQVLQNPIGITGRKVQVEIGASSELRTAAAGLGTIQTNFADLDTSAVPIALTASQTLIKVGFADDTKLVTSATSLPCNITLTNVDINITLQDAAGSITLPTLHVNKVVELEQRKDDLSSYQIMTQDVFVGNILSAQEAKQLQDVITSGGSNQVIVQVSIHATSVPELPPGSVLTLTFTTSEATVAF